MLSDHERETLLDMERRLLADDPSWARTFDDAETGQHADALWPGPPTSSGSCSRRHCSCS